MSLTKFHFHYYYYCRCLRRLHHHCHRCHHRHHHYYIFCSLRERKTFLSCIICKNMKNILVKSSRTRLILRIFISTMTYPITPLNVEVHRVWSLCHSYLLSVWRNSLTWLLNVIVSCTHMRMTIKYTYIVDAETSG